MKNSTGSRVFRIAIAGSLFVHAVFAFVVRSHAVEAAPEQRPRDLPIIHLVLSTPTPEPPQPRQSVQPHPVTQHVRPIVQPPVIAKNNAGPPSQVVPSAVPGSPRPWDDSPPGTGPTGPPDTPAPPTPTPKPACSSPDIAARAIDAVTPERPEDADANATRTQVRVNLDAKGNVTGASVYTSSGDQRLDSAAVRAAQSSRYAPEEHDCKNVPGSYLFTVDFQE